VQQQAAPLGLGHALQRQSSHQSRLGARPCQWSLQLLGRFHSMLQKRPRVIERLARCWLLPASWTLWTCAAQQSRCPTRVWRLLGQPDNLTPVILFGQVESRGEYDGDHSRHTQCPTSSAASAAASSAASAAASAVCHAVCVKVCMHHQVNGWLW
jgi:hypothetical protein